LIFLLKCSFPFKAPSPSTVPVWLFVLYRGAHSCHQEVWGILILEKDSSQDRDGKGYRGQKEGAFSTHPTVTGSVW